MEFDRFPFPVIHEWHLSDGKSFAVQGRRGQPIRCPPIWSYSPGLSDFTIRVLDGSVLFIFCFEDSFTLILS